MKQQENTTQGPVDMSQEEMDRLRRGDPKITRLINKRIASGPLPKTESTDKPTNDSPAQLTAGQLKEIKRTGKIPSPVRAAIEKEKEGADPSAEIRYKYPEHEKPELSPPKK